MLCPVMSGPSLALGKPAVPCAGPLNLEHLHGCPWYLETQGYEERKGPGVGGWCGQVAPAQIRDALFGPFPLGDVPAQAPSAGVDAANPQLGAKAATSVPALLSTPTPVPIPLAAPEWITVELDLADPRNNSVLQPAPMLPEFSVPPSFTEDLSTRAHRAAALIGHMGLHFAHGVLAAEAEGTVIQWLAPNVVAALRTVERIPRSIPRSREAYVTVSGRMPHDLLSTKIEGTIEEVREIILANMARTQ